MNLDDFRKLTERGVGLAVASRDRHMKPDLTDLMGFKLSSDGKTLVGFVNAVESHTTLQNFKSCPQVAISMAGPCDCFAAQVKGSVTHVRPMTNEEQKISQRWADKYKAELLLINSDPKAISCIVFDADTTLEVTVEEVFIQTPGVDAGKRLAKL